MVCCPDVCCITASSRRLRCNSAAAWLWSLRALPQRTMPLFERNRLAAAASCLVLQASLIGLGLLVDRWLNPKAPCCIQHLVL
jgi:hypothetical protein